MISPALFIWMDRMSGTVVCGRATALAPCPFHCGAGGFCDQKRCVSSRHLPFTLVRCNRPLEGELTPIPRRNQKTSRRMHSISCPRSHRKALFGRRQYQQLYPYPRPHSPAKGLPRLPPVSGGSHRSTTRPLKEACREVNATCPSGCSAGPSHSPPASMRTSPCRA